MVAVGTLTYTASVPRGRGQKIVATWVSDASGNVSGIPIPSLNGVVTRLTTIPHAGGTAPTTLYDIVLNDDEGIDVAAGLLANRSATVTESVSPMLGGSTNVPSQVVGSITPVVSNAGNAKSGIIIIYLDMGP